MDDLPLSWFEVDCDGSACGSPRGAGLHVHAPQDGISVHGPGWRVIMRDGRRTGYADAEGITRLVMRPESGSTATP